MTLSDPNARADALPTDALVLMQLLCTRLCHDMAGPVGAVNTGAEFLEEMPGEPVDADTLALLADSARSAAARLKALRLALGVAKGRSPSLVEAVSVLGPHLAAGGKSLETDVDRRPDPGPLAVQALINLVMVAADAWPRSGRILVEEREEAGRRVFSVVADGGSALAAPWTDALAGTLPIDAVEPRTAQAVLTGHLVASSGGVLLLESAAPGRLEFALG